MALPKITLSAGIAPKEGAIGTYLISLDTATLGADYIFSSQGCASYNSAPYGLSITCAYLIYSWRN